MNIDYLRQKHGIYYAQITKLHVAVDRGQPLETKKEHRKCKVIYLAKQIIEEQLTLIVQQKVGADLASLVMEYREQPIDLPTSFTILYKTNVNGVIDHHSHNALTLSIRHFMHNPATYAGKRKKIFRFLIKNETYSRHIFRIFDLILNSNPSRYLLKDLEKIVIANNIDSRFLELNIFLERIESKYENHPISPSISLATQEYRKREVELNFIQDKYQIALAFFIFTQLQELIKSPPPPREKTEQIKLILSQIITADDLPYVKDANKHLRKIIRVLKSFL